ncbi:MAG: dipicolinate synthase subunit B [bacterium]
MDLKDRKIGYALTGSHCTLEKSIPVLEEFVHEGADITPIIADSVMTRDTKFGPAKKWLDDVLKITNKPIVNSIVKAEPIGPGNLLDLLVIAPCTGNTMAKLANGIIDETVVMAAKAHLRNEKPVLIALATNDGLGVNAKNLGILLNMKNIFFVPFGQDNPSEKKNSLVSRFDLVKKQLNMPLNTDRYNQF